MIFRRRRTRIEIEQTTLRVEGSGFRPSIVIPSPGMEAAPACILSLPAAEQIERQPSISALPTTSTTTEETH